MSLAQAVLEQRARGKDVPASVLEEGVASVKQASLCLAWFRIVVTWEIQVLPDPAALAYIA